MLDDTFGIACASRLAQNVPDFAAIDVDVRLCRYSDDSTGSRDHRALHAGAHINLENLAVGPSLACRGSVFPAQFNWSRSVASTHLHSVAHFEAVVLLNKEPSMTRIKRA